MVGQAGEAAGEGVSGAEHDGHVLVLGGEGDQAEVVGAKGARGAAGETILSAITMAGLSGEFGEAGAWMVRRRTSRSSRRLGR